MKKRFSPLQRNVLIACLILYSTAYLNRLNLSAVMGSLMEALDLNATRIGVLPTAFAVVYAIGQMVNGAIVDRLNPARHMLLGLLGSAVCNLLMAASGSFEMLLILCMLNGVFQSMLWTPLVRLMGIYFKAEERSHANIYISLTLIIGHLGAWAISGYMSSLFDWRASFIAPALFAIPILLYARWLLRDAKVEPAPAKAAGARAEKASLRGIWGMYWASGFMIILVVSVLHGFVRDSIRTWAPQILGELSGDSMSATTLSLIIPLINTIGLVISYALQRVPALRNRRIAALFMLVCTVFFALLCGVNSVGLCALLMGCACACLSGVDPLMTTLIPLEYDREKLIGLSAGLTDSLIYVGSALSGVLAGYIRESMGLNALFISWVAAAIVAAVFSAVSDGMLARYRKTNE